MATVTLDEVNKVYDNGFHAIHDLSLDIADKEFLVLVGPSGCGKSTALRMIAGLETITGGTMRIGDRVVNDVEPKDRDIAMVFQNYALYPHMTVYDNIGFALKLAKVPKDEIDTRVRKAASILELETYLDRKPGQLSGGQRQRVAMGRAIVRQPAAFLMDEPLSNLDAKLRVQMRAEIAALQRELGGHHRLRHPRPDRGDDDGRSGRRAEGRVPAAGRHAAEPVRPPGQRVRRRVHRVAVDEPVRGHAPTSTATAASVAARVADARLARRRGARRPAGTARATTASGRSSASARRTSRMPRSPRTSPANRRLTSTVSLARGARLGDHGALPPRRPDGRLGRSRCHRGEVRRRRGQRRRPFPPALTGAHRRHRSRSPSSTENLHFFDDRTREAIWS